MLLLRCSEGEHSGGAYHICPVLKNNKTNKINKTFKKTKKTPIHTHVVEHILKGNTEFLTVIMKWEFCIGWVIRQVKYLMVKDYSLFKSNSTKFTWYDHIAL